MAISGNKVSRVALFGGTFDPIHRGHVESARELLEVLELDRVHMVPCAQPVHRGQPGASAEQRLAMLQLAVSDCRGLVADDREISRAGASYSIDTVIELRREVGDAACLFLAVGADAFAAMGSWHRAPEFLDYCNVVVIHRPGYELQRCLDGLSVVVQDWLAGDEMPSRGCVYGLALSPWDVSATALRRQIDNESLQEHLLVPAVKEYIQAHGLYRS